jgi:uncharacterized protein YkwD
MSRTRKRGFSLPGLAAANVLVMPTPSVVRRRRTIKALSAWLLIGLAAAIAGRVRVVRNSAQAPERAASNTAEESRLMDLVNRTRSAAGRSPLAWSRRLAVIARGHSYDMALRHYLAHESLEGVTPAERIRGEGIGYQELGENIYLDQNPDGELPQRAIEGWMASPPHRDNLLSADFRESGIGVAHGADGETYVTQDFIR